MRRETCLRNNGLFYLFSDCYGKCVTDYIQLVYCVVFFIFLRTRNTRFYDKIYLTVYTNTCTFTYANAIT